MDQLDGSGALVDGRGDPLWFSRSERLRPRISRQAGLQRKRRARQVACWRRALVGDVSTGQQEAVLVSGQVSHPVGMGLAQMRMKAASAMIFLLARVWCLGR
jgi:hypothetical protein